MLFETSIDQDSPSNNGHMGTMHYQVKNGAKFHLLKTLEEHTHLECSLPELKCTEISLQH